jgi:hypothetical protein
MLCYLALSSRPCSKEELMIRILLALAICGVFAKVLLTVGQAPAGVAAPHFLQPDSFRVDAHKPFALRFGDADGRPVAWRNDRVRWAFARVAATQTNADAPTLDKSGQPTATLDHAGIAVVGIDLQPRDLTIDAAELRKFIADRGSIAEGAEIPEDAGQLRIRHVETFKTIIRCGQKGAEEGPSEAMGEATQAAEIQLVLDPTALTLPSDLLIRISAHSDEVEDQRLFATHIPTGRTVQCTSAEEGYAHISLDAPGPWRLEFHHLAAAPPGEDPPLVLYSATVTFNAGALPGEAP